MFDMPEEIALRKFGVDMETLRAAMWPAPDKYRSWSFYPIREEVKDNDYIQTTVYCKTGNPMWIGFVTLKIDRADYTLPASPENRSVVLDQFLGSDGVLRPDLFDLVIDAVKQMVAPTEVHAVGYPSL